MPVYTSDALILRTYKLGEADRIVVFLTRDRGKKRGVAKGARRPRSKFTGALESLTRAGVAYYERELRDLVRINYIEPQARKGVEPYASYLKLAGDAPVPRFAEPEKIGVVVVGGETNGYWRIAGARLAGSACVDDWR